VKKTDCSITWFVLLATRQCIKYEIQCYDEGKNPPLTKYHNCLC